MPQKSVAATHCNAFLLAEKTEKFLPFLLSFFIFSKNEDFIFFFRLVKVKNFFTA